jgi:hypothetical protein
MICRRTVLCRRRRRYYKRGGDPCGRFLLNGVAADAVCRLEPSASSGRFIYIEQDPEFRNPRDWVEAIERTFP